MCYLDTQVTVKGIVASYDEKHKNYSVTLENTIDVADLEITLLSDKSKLNVEIDGVTYTDVTEVIVEDMSVPGIGKKQIEFTVTSEEGTIDTRTIIISQFSSNVELEEIKFERLAIVSSE